MEEEEEGEEMKPCVRQFWQGPHRSMGQKWKAGRKRKVDRVGEEDTRHRRWRCEDHALWCSPSDYYYYYYYCYYYSDDYPWKYYCHYYPTFRPDGAFVRFLPGKEVKTTPTPSRATSESTRWNGSRVAAAWRCAVGADRHRSKAFAPLPQSAAEMP